MSFKVSKILQFPQSTLQYIPQDEVDIDSIKGYPLPTLGGVLSDTRYVWQAKGPCLEIKDINKGIKVGAWTFGCILRDSNAKILCVDEILRPNGRISLLAVGIECGISGSMICVFEVFGSKVIRAIQIREKVTSLHVVDSGHEVLNLPGPLRNFDGIIAVGTEGGNVYLIDICRQICEEALHSLALKDELCPCQLILLTPRDISKIEYYKERSVREGNHLAIHLNVVLNSLTQHFTLKGPKGDDRIHVNRDEVKTSALYYCPQLTSLLIGLNFGAYQLWDLTNLKLIYTSAICKEHLPITHFALQEPSDDPRAFCYIWVIYSNTSSFQTGLPLAVMYSLCYESKEYQEGYGYLYQDFQMCSVRFQTELGPLEGNRGALKVKGGYCVAVNPICKAPASKDLYSHDGAGETLALCVISWSVWYNQSETQTFTILFDLNQWYKEQMPEFTKWADCSNYVLKIGISDLTVLSGRKVGTFLDIKMDKKSLRQFLGVQKLEEHFCPSALSFDLCGLRENDIVLIHSEGLQRALLGQIEGAGPLCLIRPSDIYRQVIILGMMPLFTDLSLNASISTDVQREVILNVGLEHQLISWLCKCATEWANGSFSSAGCSLDFLIYWAFQRAVVLKTNCDKYCMPLFDYSQSRLDNNTSVLLNSCIRQINSLCTFYSYVINKLYDFISNPELVIEQHTSLKMVSTYFEVLQWLVNVGLLPECHPSTYPRPNMEKISAPYPVQELTDYYNEKRAHLQLLSKDSFVSSDSLLFIDNLINNKCGAENLQKQWQEDGGSGLYPPPSLQSMLRTYLVEGADISHKHSLVIYVFLDLAMALDQGRYTSVITHLIKFPAVFKVSSSIIKITQAFWQLDHGDYTTAMEQLLDPFVLGDDLEPWHHAIAMRALLLQNQYNFALLYMQVRKPPVTNEKDILTAISLFIANGMLDEAFYFKNQHHCNNDEKLLMHLFNECNKNDSLHVLLYRCMNNEEEKAFFKYLKSVENPTADDLQVFYYLLRSRFVEAFDTHDSSKRKKPDSQGLIGQRNASKTDQIVRIFKTLLPDVNRNLVDVVRKERVNLWKEVARPTPLSVFVHNTNEQIQYKSTLIHAALSKAKGTFQNSKNGSKFKDIVTEETPFLRTPKALRTKFRQVTPVITPKMIDINESGEEMGPSPPKKLKLTPRASTTSPTCIQNISLHSKMLTPIVKRKLSLLKDQSILMNGDVCTPQSILKVRNLVCNTDDTIDDMLENYDGLARIDSSPRKSALGLQPRRSLSRTSRRPQVKFDDAANFSSTFSDQSNKLSLNNTSFEEKSTLSSKDISLMVSSKNSSGSNTDDIFYSPNSSISEVSKSQEESIAVDKSELEEVVAEPVIELSKVEGILEEDVHIQSPRARRSYKRSLGDSAPVRSSPRLIKAIIEIEKPDLDAKKDNISDDISLDNAEGTTMDVSIQESTLDIPLSMSLRQSPRLLQKVKGRKSLSRTVLEHNTFSKMLAATPRLDTTITKETSLSTTEKITISNRTINASDVTTVESKQEVSNFSYSKPTTPDNKLIYGESSFVSKKRIFESTSEDSDTSIESSIFMDSPELPERLKLSDSLLEYIKSRNSKQADQSLNESSEVREEDLEINNRTIDSEQNLDDEQTKENDDEIVKGESVETGKKSENFGDSKSQMKFMEVYEDLSSGAEDIEEVLSAGKNESCGSKVYTELFNYSEHTYNELERNIFDLTESREQSFEDVIILGPPENVSTSTDPNSESFDIPVAEKGFLHDKTKLETSAASMESYLSEGAKPSAVDNYPPQVPEQKNEVIEISSSSDNDETSSNSDTSESRSSEKSKSDIDELNISYERNIHAEDSGSLADSQFSRMTEEHGSEEEEPHEVGEEKLQDEDNRAFSETSHERELEINEDHSPVEWLNKQYPDDEENEIEVETHDCEMLEIDKIASENEERYKLEEHESNIVESVDVVLEVNDGPMLLEQEGRVEIRIENYERNQDGERFIVEESVSISHMDKEETISPEGVLQMGNKMESPTQKYENDSNESVCKGQEIEVEREITDLPEENVVLEEGSFGSNPEEVLEDNIPLAEGGFGDKSETKTEEDPNEARQSKSNMTEIDEVINTQNEKKNLRPSKEEKISKTEEKETNTTKIGLMDKTTSIRNDESSRRNQSTNTTLSPVRKSPEKDKVEQATNTTVYMRETEPSVKNDSVLEIDRPKDRRVYHPKYGTMKLLTEDQTVSSITSDTTEGEIPRQDILVTAQVHTPNKKRAATPLGHRLTRSNALSELAQVEESSGIEESAAGNVSSYDIMDEEYQHTMRQTPKKAYVTDILDDSNLTSTLIIDSMATDESDVVLTPGRRTRRSLSATLTPTRSANRRRSLQMDKLEGSNQPSTSKEPEQEPPRTPRRTRSISVDEINPQFKKRSLRSNSVEEKLDEDVKEQKPKGRGRASSVSLLPVISEETKEKTRTGQKSKASSSIEAYATTRRLTRRQASLVKGMETPSSVTAQDDSDVEKDLDVDAIDPINLLDKEPFEGKPDPDEEKVYEPSSPSNSTTSSFNRPAKRTSRSASMASDSSLPPSVSQASTPKRRTRRSVGPMECPSPSGVTTRSRKQSETSSVTSDKSEPPSPPKRSKKKDSEETSSIASVASSSRKTRRRADSTSSLTSDKSTSPKRTTRSRRLVSAVSELPEIVEEKGNETGDLANKPTKRHTRKKSSQ